MRIVILGNAGSGKSTLARRLSVDLGIPAFHMDRLFWQPGWRQSSDDDLRARVAEVVATDEWIIDGNYSRVLPMRLERADIAIVLDVPVWLSLLRVGKRWFMYFGRTRPDMGEGCREKLLPDFEFFRWIISWPQRRPRTLALLEQHPHLRVIHLSGRWKHADLLAKLRASPAAAP